jgi:N-acetylmuramidase
VLSIEFTPPSGGFFMSDEMTDWNGFRGAAKRLDDIDLPRIGARIGVGEDELHAFMEVEAAGSGFDRQGRPKMLFEPHVFWRHLPKAKRAEAERQGLAYPKWKPGAYPKTATPA